MDYRLIAQSAVRRKHIQRRVAMRHEEMIRLYEAGVISRDVLDTFEDALAIRKCGHSEKVK